MTVQSGRLIWIDLEMTGLDSRHDSIIEIATVVTDQNLDIAAEGPVLAIHQSDARLDEMDEWNTRQHGRSGLTQRVKESTTGTRDAEQQTLNFLSALVERAVRQWPVTVSVRTGVFLRGKCRSWRHFSITEISTSVR